MNGFLRGMWLIVTLDLKQRVRGIAWYVLLGVFVVLVTAVTALVVIATNAWDSGGGGVFSTIVFFVLLLGTLVSPALSGNAINGEREAGTLATTQVTLVTTAQLVIGKWVAAWLTALAFLAASLPFLAFGIVLGEVSPATVITTVLVLAVELGIIAAIGVGLSGLVTRPLFSVVVTYLVVAALSVGTLIAFGLGGAAVQTTVKQTIIGVDYQQLDENGLAPGGGEVPCLPPNTWEQQTPRFDLVWGFLAANPYVVVADAAPGSFDEDGNPTDLFGWIAVGVRQAQQAPETEVVIDECSEYSSKGYAPYDSPTPREIYDGSVPSWFVGLTIHLLLGAGALAWAWRRTEVPAKRLAAGSRIA
ncbi:ABC transporter permease [Agromyces sp. H3Y2-19a]|uniref:ABC transporter permease n=1 Tax=Agromyces chromiiresistens TaxID=3030835 RepID=UPI0023B95008|nr:ABC transporter permease [Agromyces chromiiresistens]MDF0512906.1 ABC transporter permease [Agromyces chromiiresistens]